MFLGGVDRPPHIGGDLWTSVGLAPRHRPPKFGGQHTQELVKISTKDGCHTIFEGHTSSMTKPPRKFGQNSSTEAWLIGYKRGAYPRAPYM